MPGRDRSDSGIAPCRAASELVEDWYAVRVPEAGVSLSVAGGWGNENRPGASVRPVRFVEYTEGRD